MAFLKAAGLWWLKYIVQHFQPSMVGGFMNFRMNRRRPGASSHAVAFSQIIIFIIFYASGGLKAL